MSQFDSIVSTSEFDKKHPLDLEGAQRTIDSGGVKGIAMLERDERYYFEVAYVLRARVEELEKELAKVKADLEDRNSPTAQRTPIDSSKFKEITHPDWTPEKRMTAGYRPSAQVSGPFPGFHRPLEFLAGLSGVDSLNATEMATTFYLLGWADRSAS